MGFGSHLEVVGRRDKLLHFLPGEDIGGDEVAFGVTVLASLGGGDVNDLRVGVGAAIQAVSILSDGHRIPSQQRGGGQTLAPRAHADETTAAWPTRLEITRRSRLETPQPVARRLRTASSSRFRGRSAHLCGAAFDHHEATLADATRLHGVDQGRAGIGGLELLDIIIITHTD